MEFIVDAVARTLRWTDAGGTDVRFPVIIGRSGFTPDKREGDGMTPLGGFPVRRAFWRPDRLERPTSALPLAPITPEDGWCDDPAHADYNLAIRLPHLARHERLWRDDHVYDLVLVIGHNDDPVVPGLGSAVFVHLTRPERTPTEGCVALDLPDMRRLLAAMGPGDVVVIEGPGTESVA